MKLVHDICFMRFTQVKVGGWMKAISSYGWWKVGINYLTSKDGSIIGQIMILPRKPYFTTYG